MNVEYVGKDQNWQDESTTYWFRLSGIDTGTGLEFGMEQCRELFGIVESGPESVIVNSDGIPLTPSDWRYIAVSRHCVVTDSMRMDQ